MKHCRIASALIAVIAASSAANPCRAGERFSLHAFADVESAYICRGYIWDVRPYSAQYVDGELSLDDFGAIDASVWTMSAMSGSGNSARMSRYAYAEADYLLRYTYAFDIAEGWRLSSGVARQWVTNPGYKGGHTVCDWQFMQSLSNPFLTPYWKVRLIRRPFDETYWIVGVKKSFELMEGLKLTVDLAGDLGDSRHFANLYGPKPNKPTGSYRGGLQALSLVFRLDYALTDHIGLFAFVGQFDLVSDEARSAVKALKVPEARRDLTFGGVGVSVDF